VLIKERYRLQKQIGKGGFCKTFLAVDEDKFPPVPCIVQQFPHHQTSEESVKKAQQLQELGKHPQIPTLFAHFRENEYFYLVQEFIKGNNLATLIEEQGTFSETQIWQLLQSLLPVIKIIHNHQIIHGDIKPENIICRNFYKANLELDLVLVDFAGAKLLTAIDRFTDEPVIGSPEYAAPEQTRGKAVFASDLYSLGVTCIYLLTQIPPFDLFDVANNSWIWRDYLTTKISNHLAQTLDKLLQNNVTKRFQSADEVIQILGIKDNYLRLSAFVHSSKLKAKNNSWKYLYTLTGNIGASSSINSLSFNPNGNILASGDDDKITKLWDLDTQKILANLRGHTQAVKSVAFSPDGQILATASDDKTIKLWNVNNLEEIFTLVGHSRAVKSIAFAPDGQILASGSWDKTIKIWDVNTGIELCTLRGHKLQINAVAFSPQRQILASASCDRTVGIWQLENLQNHPHHSLLGNLSGHTWAVSTVAFSPDGQILATGSEDNTIKLWNVNTGQLISTLSSHSWSVVAVAFTADGKTLLSASWDQTVKLWNVSTAEEIATLSGHGDSVCTVAVSPVTQLIASGSRDKTIKLWQFVEQQES
jgi:WD40 repeat protein